MAVTGADLRAQGVSPKYADHIATQINTLDPSVQSRYTQTVVDFYAAHGSDGYDIDINQAARSKSEQSKINRNISGRAASSRGSWHVVGGASDFTIFKNGKADKGVTAGNAYVTLLKPIAEKAGLAAPFGDDVGHFQPKELPKSRRGMALADFNIAPSGATAVAINNDTTGDPFGVDRFNATATSFMPIPHLRPAAQAAAALAGGTAMPAGAEPPRSYYDRASGNRPLAPPTPAITDAQGLLTNLSGKLQNVDPRSQLGAAFQPNQPLPTPPTNIPNVVPNPHQRPEIPHAPPQIAAAEEMVHAALTGNVNDIGKAGDKLLGTLIFDGDGAKKAAVTEYFRKVGEETPYGYVMADRLKSNPALADKLPKLGAKPGHPELAFDKQIIAGLTNMPSRPAFPGVDPMQDAARAPIAPPAVVPRQTFIPNDPSDRYVAPLPPNGPVPSYYSQRAPEPAYNANAAQIAAAKQRIAPQALQGAFGNRAFVPNDPSDRFVAPPPAQRATTASPDYYSMATGNQRTATEWPKASSPGMANYYANPPPTSFGPGVSFPSGLGTAPRAPIAPLSVRGVAGSGSGASVNLAPKLIPTVGSSGASTIPTVPSYYSRTSVSPSSPSYYSMATGNQRSPPVAQFVDQMTWPPKSPFVGMNASLTPLIQQFAKSVPFMSPPRTFKGPIQEGIYNQPAYQAPRQTFSPPTGILPNSAPSGGGYVSSPSTFGGVAYISGAGTQASPRIATNSQGATIRLS